MYTFIKKTIYLFTILVFVAVSIFILYEHVLYKSCYTKENIIALSNKVCIVGDSHLECGINPDLLGVPAINICQSGESPFFTYVKLKYLIEKKNIHFPMVMCGLSHHSFVGGARQNLTFDEFGYYACLKFTHLFHCIDNDDLLCDTGISKMTLLYWLVMKNYNPYNGFSRLLDLPKKNIDINYLGGFYNSGRSAIDKIDVNNIIHKYYNNSGETVSQSRLTYYKKIIDLCKRYNIRLIFINTPIHHLYYVNIPQVHMDNFNKTIKLLQSNYKIEYYDYSCSRFPDKLFGDHDHLNKYGAREFSNIIGKSLFF